MKEMDIKFNKIVVFSCQQKILEFRLSYSIAFSFTFDIH